MAEIRINATGELKLYDSDDSNYVSFKSAGTVSSNVAWTLPSADGSSGQMLSTNGSGTLSWATASSADPTSADGDSLGTASAEWSDLFLADGGIIKFGNDQDVLLTHVADTGLLLSGTNVIQFNDASQNIGAPSNAILDINATDEIELNATAVDLNGTLDVSGNSQFSGTITVGVDDTGKDVKFFGATASSYLEWDESADDLNLIASGLGVITAKDLGTGIHVRTSDSGASVNSEANQLVLEHGGSGIYHGMSILSQTDGGGTIFFGDSGDDNIGMIYYSHGSNHIVFKTNAANALTISSTAQLSTSTEGAPDVDGGGLCLQQNASDGNIMSFKSSDVAHGITGNAETDTFAEIGKSSATEGGFRVSGFAEGVNDAIEIKGTTVSAPDSNNSTSASACIKIDGAQKSGTGRGAIAAGDNVFKVGNNDTNCFIIKGDGELYSNQSATVQTFDSYEDAQLVRALDLSRDKNLAGVINSKFDDYIKYNHETLANAKLVGREEDGTPNHFVNVTGMQRLHNGAIWQQYEKHERLLEAVYDLAKEAVGEDKANAILDKHEVKRLQ